MALFESAIFVWEKDKKHVLKHERNAGVILQKFWNRRPHNSNYRDLPPSKSGDNDA